VTDADHEPLLMIPGPVALSPAVLAAMAEPPRSHTSPAFVEVFARVLDNVRAVWGAGADHQPFVVAGSGTLAMEMAATNVIGPGQRALVLQTGVFGDRMADVLARRGAVVRRIEVPVGHAVAPAAVAAAVAEDAPDAVFVTHVDTSTGVRVDLEGIAAAIRAADPRPLLVVDGVCSVGGERLRQADWGLDVVLTASQKALSAPPGLALVVASPRALEARRALVTLPPLTVDFDAWLPVHQAYEAGRPSYFATPATGLVRALDAALAELVAEGIDAVVARHARVAAAVRAGLATLGVAPVPGDPSAVADTLSALWLPEGVGPELVGRVAERGVLIAGGLHPDNRARSFRVGHMGWVGTQPELILRTVRAVGEALGADAEAAVARCRSALG
jgi:alanine-glyoxylate transaminase / serine-glyoxylate transaminase / serine-pyruvate transaminase